MKRFIAITTEQRGKLEKIFGCTPRMISYALAFDTRKGNTDLAKRIRKAALEMGARVTVVTTEMESMVDSEGTLHQVFPNGAHIELYKSDGRGVIIFNGETVAEYENVKVREIGAIQQRAQLL